MNRNLLLITLILMLIANSSCGQYYLPGFNFKLFKSTPVSQLSQVVETEDTIGIKRVLMDTAIRIDYQEPKFGHSLLMLAVANGKYKSAQCLLEHGAKPNLMDSAMTTSVHIAIQYNYRSPKDTLMIDLLLKHGGDINALQVLGREGTADSYARETPLTMAVREHFADTKPLIIYLLKHGADPNFYTRHEGYCAITAAIVHQNLDAAFYLIKYEKTIIPPYAYIRKQRQGPNLNLTITDMLNEGNYKEGSNNYKLKNEIIQYLTSKGLR